MPAPTNGPEFVRFGDFVLDLRSGELAKSGGDRTLLADQPFRLLATLVRQPGVLVTRDDLRRELWADDTFVDFEHSLNAAIKRLREVLGDSATAPRFIETLPRRGYRFIAPVTTNGGDPSPEVPEVTQDATPVLTSTPEPAPRNRGWFTVRAMAIGLAATGLLIAAVVAVWIVAPWRRESPPVIAVLPFENLSVEPDSQYFVDGLTDEIIRNLAVIEGLAVRSRTSSFTFAKKPRNTRDVGEALEATLLLEGSVLREGQRLRINAQLVRVVDDVMLWSGRFDRELNDVFAIQDEISRSIVNQLRLELGRGQRRYATSIEAYDLFLKARVLQARRAADSRRAVELFQQVLQRDPAFAPAYAGIASAYAQATYLYPNPGSDLATSPSEADAVMRPAALKALELDPLLADAHAAMGNLHAFDGQWSAAEASFRRALELNPSLTTTYTDFVLSTLFPGGKLDEAMRQLEAALRRDPLSLDIRRVLANIQISAGLYDRARENCDRVLAVDPTFPFVDMFRARALLHQGRVSEAVAWFEGQDARTDGYKGYAYAISGRRVEAEALAAANREYPQRQVLIYSGLGDTDRAFEALDKLASANPRRTGAYLTLPELARLRSHPRMAAVRARLGLPR
jgi:TolB-like protein/DNA-binding winged helix-turn-helix (wHTH) protein/lipopolysaccharide biosynthesis regulator YciM